MSTSSLLHTRLIGQELFKNIVKMSNEIDHSDKIKNRIGSILTNMYKLPLLIDYIPTTTLVLFGYNYYTGINIINTVIPMDRSHHIHNTIKFIVDIYKIPDSPNSIQLLIRLLFNNNLYTESYTFYLVKTDNITQLIIEWITNHLFNFIYKYGNIDGFHFEFFKKLLNKSYTSIPTLETIRPVPISLVDSLSLL